MIDIKAEILTIGDEILYGQITDTNSQWISSELDKIGIKIIRKTAIGDQESEIISTFKEAENRAEIIIITGGLGPTHDDLTKACLAKYFDCELVLNQEALDELTTLFTKFGREVNETNRQQAYLPEKCHKISNKVGTAPGMWFDKGSKVFVSMPGVPIEMKKMMTDSVIPRLREKFNTPVIIHKFIKTIGIGESWLSDKLINWEKALPDHIKLAYLPSLGQVRLRLTGKGSNEDNLEDEIEQEVDKLKKVASKYIYGYNDDTIENAVGQLLLKNKKTIATAESCTGGHLAHRITSIPGSSNYFQGGVIPYNNDIKEDLLAVKHDTLLNHGAVSKETVEEMANNVRTMFNADIGVACSGIAGPSGGTKEKPVGTIWIALKDEQGTISKMLTFGNDRMINIQLTTLALLNLIRQRLIKNNG